jgi:hypothetical protein
VTNFKKKILETTVKIFSGKKSFSGKILKKNLRKHSGSFRAVALIRKSGNAGPGTRPCHNLV